MVLSHVETPRPVRSAMVVVLLVGTGRAALELAVASIPSDHTVLSLLTSVTFYAEALVLYASAIRYGTKLEWSSALSTASFGLVTGLVPPVLDAFLGGPGSGSYSYFFRPLAEWPLLLFDARVTTLGESLSLWLSLMLVAVYVGYRARSWSRVLQALAISYIGIFILGAAPQAMWRWISEDFQAMWPMARDAREFCALATQVVVAEVVYLLNRPGALRRIAFRLPHILPFLCLTLLGGAVRRSEDKMGNLLAGKVSIGFAVAVLSVVAISAIVSNDALEHEELKPSAFSPADALFIAACTTCICLAMFVYNPRSGLMLTFALLLSVVYHDKALRAKSIMPLNGLIEGGWAWCSLATGYFCHPQFRQPMSGRAALLSGGVFTGWCLFSAFKDYKDIRFDRRVHNVTVYTLALEHGWSLRRIHLGLLAMLVLAQGFAIALVGFEWGWGRGVLLAIASSITMSMSLLARPGSRSVRMFLWGVSALVVGISWQIIHSA